VFAIKFSAELLYMVRRRDEQISPFYWNAKAKLYFYIFNYFFRFSKIITCLPILGRFQNSLVFEIWFSGSKVIEC